MNIAHKYNDNESLSFEELINKQEAFLFYGVDMNMFKLNNAVFEAIEDENDGYRSMLDVIERKSQTNGLFFDMPLAKVIIKRHGSETKNGSWTDRTGDETDFFGYELVDITDSHVWLRFGTDNVSDYYPTFIFEYMPKQGQREFYREYH